MGEGGVVVADVPSVTEEDCDVDAAVGGVEGSVHEWLLGVADADLLDEDGVLGVLEFSGDCGFGVIGGNQEFGGRNGVGCWVEVDGIVTGGWLGGYELALGSGF